ncbi:MAG: diguanylate cyclase [Pseudomonadota bacterium]
MTPLDDIDLNSIQQRGEEQPPVDNRDAEVHRHVLSEVQRAVGTLLSVKSVFTLIKYLLKDFPERFGSPQAELWLHDPQDRLGALAPMGTLFRRSLRLELDSEALYRLYTDRPAVCFLTLADEQMFTLFPGADEAVGCAMLPLYDGNRLVGSYHLLFTRQMMQLHPHDLDLLNIFAGLCAAALQRVVESQDADRNMLLDPVTELGNLRAFRRNVIREVNWARRTGRPLALLALSIDELEELSQTHGEGASRSVLRNVAQHIDSLQRATDHIAHMHTGQFSALLPDCNEPNAHAIAERLRSDLDQYVPEDPNGVALYVSLSIGMVCWNPRAHPVASSERLGAQLEREAESAMRTAERAGGNQISVAHLGLLML